MTLYFTCEFLIQGCACVIGAHSEAMSPRPQRCFDEAGLDIKFVEARVDWQLRRENPSRGWGAMHDALHREIPA